MESDKEALAELLKGKKHHEINSLAHEESTSPEILKLLALHDDKFIRHNVAANPNTPTEILYKLENDEDDYVRTGLARNPILPYEITIKLSKDNDKDVRKWIAGNRNTPNHILQILACDTESEVREYVAMNKNTPLETLKSLSEDENYEVRHWVAYNEKTTTDILIRLAEDKTEYVQKTVLFNQNTPKRIKSKLRQTLIQSDFWRYRMEIAEDTETPKYILLKLAKDEYWSVKKAVIKNPNTPIHILRKFAEKKDYDIHFAIVDNPNCPIDILRKFIEDDTIYNFHRHNYDEDVRWTDTLPRQISKHKWTPPEILKILGNNEDIIVRQNVAENTNTPTVTLCKLLTSLNQNIKTAALYNPNTPHSLIWLQEARNKILKKLLPVLVEQYYVKKEIDKKTLCDTIQKTGLNDEGNIYDNDKPIMAYIDDIPENMDTREDRKKLWNIIIKLTGTEQFLTDFDNSDIDEINLQTPNTDKCKCWQESLFEVITRNTSITDYLTLRRLGKMISLYKTTEEEKMENHTVLYHVLFHPDEPLIFTPLETIRILESRNLWKVYNGHRYINLIDGDILFRDNQYCPIADVFGVYQDTIDNNYVFVVTKNGDRGVCNEYEERFKTEDEAYMKLYKYITGLGKTNNKEQ